MRWTPSNRPGLTKKGWWSCRIKYLGYHRARKERLREKGLCVQCGKDVAVTETLCFLCVGKRDEYNTARVT